MSTLVPEQNIEWVQGDDNVEYITVTAPTGAEDPVTQLPVVAAVDLTNGKVWLVAKRNSYDADVDAAVLLDSEGNGIVITNAAQGLAKATIPRAALAGLAAPLWLRYSVQARVDQSPDPLVWEVVRGTVYVSKGLLAAV